MAILAERKIGQAKTGPQIRTGRQQSGAASFRSGRTAAAGPRGERRRNSSLDPRARTAAVRRIFRRSGGADPTALMRKVD